MDASFLVADGLGVDLFCTVSCLGVTVDHQLTFADHVKRITGR